MSRKPDLLVEKPADRKLTLTRVFNAPRHLVFEAWTKQEHLDQWFLPDDFTRVEYQADLRPGGVWRSAMLASDGEPYNMGGVYREIVPDERLVFTHAWDDDDGHPEHETTISVTFTDHEGGATLMKFEQEVFKSVESRDGHKKGWSQCFNHLDDHLAKIIV